MEALTYSYIVKDIKSRFESLILLLVALTIIGVILTLITKMTWLLWLTLLADLGLFVMNFGLIKSFNKLSPSNIYIVEKFCIDKEIQQTEESVKYFVCFDNEKVNVTKETYEKASIDDIFYVIKTSDDNKVYTIFNSEDHKLDAALEDFIRKE